MDQLEHPELTPAETLKLVEDQRRSVEHALDLDPRILYGAWGLAWFVGFGVLWLTGGGPSGTFVVPPGWAFAVFGLLLTGALVVTAVHSVRAGRGIRGESAQVGAMYGWTWSLAFLAYGAMFVGLDRIGVSDEVFGLLSVFVAALLVGVMYMAGGAVWRERSQFVLGVWIVVVAAAGVVSGLPWNYLVMAVAGGGGFLLGAAWLSVRPHR